MNYDEAVKYIEETPKFADNGSGRNKSGNQNLSNVMEYLGHPERKHKAIHIAGTNGKGSTVRMIMSILCNRGYSVGTFISPHLVRVNERISVSALSEDGLRIITKDISDEEFAVCFNTVMSAVDRVVIEGGSYLSYFEMLFAIAAVYFENQKLDYVIYETGLGGRLDATNIVRPIITAITSIGLDHTAYLGDTIEQIAAEKAGIIKNGVPIVYNTGEVLADGIIEARAKKLNARAINVAKSEYIINELSDKTIDFSCFNSYYRYDNIILFRSQALYQIDNAMTAIEVCNNINEDNMIISEKIIKKAIRMFFWPGRMERIRDNLVVDGAHNEDAIIRFVESVRLCYPNRKKCIMFAVASDKDYKPMIDYLVRKLELDKIFVTAIASGRSVSAEYVAACFRKSLEEYGGSCEVFWDDDIKSCLNRAYEYVEGTDGILFCVGSLYLVGSIEELAREEI